MITVEGLEEVQKFLEERVQRLQGPPMFAVMREATLLVQRSAKISPPMPVDTGRLRASITPEVTQMGGMTVGIVGSNVEYAPYQELGFRTRVAKGKEKGPRKFIKGKMFLQKAFTKNIKNIEALYEAFVGRLVQGG